MKASLQMPLTQIMKENHGSAAAAVANNKEPQDLAILRFLLLLQVAGERKAEIEELLRGTAGLCLPNDESSSSSSSSAVRPSGTAPPVAKRPPLVRRWRKHLKKRPSGEEGISISSSSSSSSSTSSSTKSSSSVSPTRPQETPVCANGHLNLALEKDSEGIVTLRRETTPTEETEGMTLLQKLALNALNLTAPASSVLLSNRRSSWVQLSGHPGSLAPAGPGTIWKKRGNDPVETLAYQSFKQDPAKDITPTFFREVVYRDEYFIEMQDLLYNFENPSVMDIKMGTRTFLESEVSNNKARHDLYTKMIRVDPTAPTPEEHEMQAVTKLRYMDFRDNMSSSRSLGFRIEALKMTGSDAVTELKTVRSREDVVSTMSGFLRTRESMKRQILARLRHLRDTFSKSPFFQKHEVIGSSILIVYDAEKAGVWMIDFAKTIPVPEGTSITHRGQWVLGNHEEGFLTGVDNLIKVVEEAPITRPRRLGIFSSKS